MSEPRRLVRLVDVRFKPAGGDWLELARSMPDAIDHQGEYCEVDIAGLFGGGVQAWDGAEVELRVRWMPAPSEADE